MKKSVCNFGLKHKAIQILTVHLLFISNLHNRCIFFSSELTLPYTFFAGHEIVLGR